MTYYWLLDDSAGIPWGTPWEALAREGALAQDSIVLRKMTTGPGQDRLTVDRNKVRPLRVGDRVSFDGRGEYEVETYRGGTLSPEIRTITPAPGMGRGIGSVFLAHFSRMRLLRTPFTPEPVPLDQLREHDRETLMFTSHRVSIEAGGFAVGCQRFDTNYVRDIGGTLTIGPTQTSIKFPGEVLGNHVYVGMRGDRRAIPISDIAAYCASAETMERKARQGVRCRTGIYSCEDHDEHFYLLTVDSDGKPSIMRFGKNTRQGGTHMTSWVEATSRLDPASLCRPHHRVYQHGTLHASPEVAVEVRDDQFVGIDRVDIEV